MIPYTNKDAKEMHEDSRTRTRSVVFNTNTAGLEKLASKSVININNIVNINNTGSDMTGTTIVNNKVRAESFPLSEVDMLRKELLAQKKGMDKLKKQNQLLLEENKAMKQMLEGGDHQQKSGDQPKPAPPSANVAVVKVCYCHITVCPSLSFACLCINNFICVYIYFRIPSLFYHDFDNEYLIFWNSVIELS